VYCAPNEACCALLDLFKFNLVVCGITHLHVITHLVIGLLSVGFSEVAAAKLVPILVLHGGQADDASWLQSQS
jgi:hypothetical protein